MSAFSRRILERGWGGRAGGGGREGGRGGREGRDGGTDEGNRKEGRKEVPCMLLAQQGMQGMCLGSIPVVTTREACAVHPSKLKRACCEVALRR